MERRRWKGVRGEEEGEGTCVRDSHGRANETNKEITNEKCFFACLGEKK